MDLHPVTGRRYYSKLAGRGAKVGSGNLAGARTRDREREIEQQKERKREEAQQKAAVNYDSFMIRFNRSPEEGIIPHNVRRELTDYLAVRNNGVPLSFLPFPNNGIDGNLYLLIGLILLFTLCEKEREVEEKVKGQSFRKIC